MSKICAKSSAKLFKNVVKILTNYSRICDRNFANKVGKVPKIILLFGGKFQPWLASLSLVSAANMVGMAVSQCNFGCTLCGTVEQVYPGMWVSILCNTSSFMATSIRLSIEPKPTFHSRHVAADNRVLVCEIVLFGS